MILFILYLINLELKFILEINKAINLIKEGKLINYEGATGVEFDKFGDTFGSFVEVDLKKGKLKSKKIR